jgi:hypothetical protein
MLDLTNRKFGRLTVISFKEMRGKKLNTRPYWKCICDCGKIVIVSRNHLMSGHTVSCGCYNQEIRLAQVKDITGKRFGRLIANYDTKKRNHGKTGNAIWNCTCNCGKEVEVVSYSLINGDTQSCGCYHKEKVSLQEKESLINRLLYQYKRNAKTRCLEFSLSKEQFVQLVSSDCTYCGTKPNTLFTYSHCIGKLVYNGIDRINNNIGYTINNSKPCCKKCNFIKRRMTMEEFQKKIKNISQQTEEEKDTSISLPLVKINWVFNEVYNRYIARAGNKKLPFSLSKEKFAELTQSACHYCGEEPHGVNRKNSPLKVIYNGIDRINNSLGYTEENCVPCCEECNKMKNTLSKEEFLKHINKIIKNMNW